jgi:hypothetical protein
LGRESIIFAIVIKENEEERSSVADKFVTLWVEVEAVLTCSSGKEPQDSVAQEGELVGLKVQGKLKRF